MALANKMHTVTFTSVSEPVDAENVVQVPLEGAAVEIAGQLTPMSAQAAFERFGVELMRPHSFLCDVEDADSIGVGYKATLGGREFEVKAPPMLWNAITANSCAECVLEEREFI